MINITNSKIFTCEPCMPYYWAKLEKLRKNTQLKSMAFIDKNLSHADLSGADLSHADMHGVYLHNSTLEFADLSGADLSHAHFGNANLSGADLSYTNLSGANLNRANLSGACLYNAQLTPIKNMPVIVDNFTTVIIKNNSLHDIRLLVFKTTVGIVVQALGFYGDEKAFNNYIASKHGKTSSEIKKYKTMLELAKLNLFNE